MPINDRVITRASAEIRRNIPIEHLLLRAAQGVEFVVDDPEPRIRFTEMADSALVNTHPIHCPSCGEPLEILIDPSIRKQDCIEDCQVCCRPMTLSVTIDEGGDIQVEARTEGE